LDRVLTNFPRFFDVICGDELYFNAPFINSAVPQLGGF
jgi:hypothetical protein